MVRTDGLPMRECTNSKFIVICVNPLQSKFQIKSKQRREFESADLSVAIVK